MAERFLDRLEDPTFTQSEVLRVIDVPATTLQNWLNRKIIDLADPNPGKSARRLYSARDIAILLALKRLTNIGITAAVSASIAKDIVSRRFTEVAKNLSRDPDEDFKRSLAWTARIEAGSDGKAKVYVTKDVAQMISRSMADAIDPNPRIYVHVDIDHIIFDALRSLLAILAEEDGVDIDESTKSKGS